LGQAAAFAEAHALPERAHVVLFECAPLSGQSFVTFDYAIEVARLLCARVKDTCVVLSSALSLNALPHGIIDGSTLTYRANAALTRYCDLFLGCSSGITWLCTSDAATQIPMIQLLTRRASMYGAVVYDLDYWNLPSDHVVELRDPPAALAADCAAAVLTRGVAGARREFHEPLRLEFGHYFEIILPALLRGHLGTVAKSLAHTVARHGLRRQLASGLGNEVYRLAKTRFGQASML
jgi:hypothetical protein